jgi:hypothetical protein
MSIGTRHNSYMKLNVKACDPDFSVHVYTLEAAVKEDPTMAALRDIDQHFYILPVEQDPVAHHYVTDVLDCYSWPVVTITSGADLIAHWEGFRADMIALIPILREQIVKDAA